MGSFAFYLEVVQPARRSLRRKCIPSARCAYKNATQQQVGKKRPLTGRTHIRTT